MDTKTKSLNWGKSYTIDKASFYTGEDVTEGLRCYTDGSKLEDNCGAGINLMHGTNVITELAIPLGKHNTVFQAEVKAITEGCALIEDELDRGQDESTVCILSDSQAALLALDKLQITSKTVQDAVNALNKLGKRIDVILCWIKAHVNHPGNEKADELAKAGTEKEQTTDIPLSQQACKTLIDSHIYKIWTDRWNRLTSCRQTRIFFKKPDRTKTKDLLKLNRSQLSNCVQLITGHNYLNRHNHIIDNTIPNSCRFCELETGSHLITSCEVLWLERADAFKNHFLDANNPKWAVSGLVSFLSTATLSQLFENCERSHKLKQGTSPSPSFPTM